MDTGISLLTSSSLPHVFCGSAAVCSSAVGTIGSYSPGFISRSGRDSVSDSVSTSAQLDMWYWQLAYIFASVHIFLLVLSDHSRYKVSAPSVEQVTAVLISKHVCKVFW